MMSSERILVVEDEIIIAEGLRQDLEKYGYHVADMVLSGEKAVERAIDLRPDLIVMDIVLQGRLSGIDAGREISNHIDTPIIYLSAYGDQETAEQVRRNEPYGYLLKPYQPQELYTAIETALYKHRMERQLRESQSLYAATIENINDGIISVDRDGKITLMNPPAARLAGVERASVIREPVKSVLQLLDERTMNPMPDPVEHALREGVRIELRDYCILKSQTGEQIPVALNINPLIGERGDVDGAVLVVSDVQRQHTEDLNRRASEAKYRMLFEKSHGIAFRALADGTITDINPAGLAFLGIERLSDNEKLNLGSLFAKSSSWDRYLRKLQTDQQVRDYEITLRKENGQTADVLINATAVFDDQHKLTAHQGIIIDITRQKALHAQTLQMQKLDGIGRLAGGIAHDFNNILTSILGYSALMKANIDTQHQFYPFLETIEHSGHRGAALTDKLLGFARAGNYLMQEIDLNQIIRLALPLIRRTLKSTVQLDIGLLDDPIAINCDVMQLEQVILNLCTNANEAMPDGGKLTISTGIKTIQQAPRPGDSAIPVAHALLTVKDTGVGIPEEIGQKVFEPFFTTRPAGVASGLGLSMAYGVVQSHGGCINFTSQPGHGTSFHLFLPQVQMPEVAAATNLRPALVGGHETILVIDDETGVRDFVRDLLETFGYRVLTAADGHTGIEKYRQHKEDIDLVILDMIMPGLNGAQTFEALSQINSDIRVLIATGHSDTRELRKLLNSGALGLLKKPYMVDEFLATLRTLLQRPV